MKSKDEVKELINKQIELAKTEAYKEVLVEYYKAQADAAINYELSVKNTRSALDNLQAKQAELDDALENSDGSIEAAIKTAELQKEVDALSTEFENSYNAAVNLQKELDDSNSVIAAAEDTYIKFATEGIDPTTKSSKELDDELKQIKKDANISGSVDMDTTNATTAIENFKTKIGSINPSIALNFTSNFDKLSPTLQKNLSSILKIAGFASGGYPDTGELFIANEAGPELVGRIGHKNAVANSDQIVSGIASGVYNAMISANANSGKNSGGTYTFVTNLDGRTVAKEVFTIHNNEVKQTGKSPLLV